MEYRWLGAAMIVIGCGSCGFSIAAGKRKEEQILCQLIRILQFMEAELRYRLTPLPDLCRLASCEAKGTLRAIFLNLYRELSWQKMPDAASCMSAAIQRTGEVPGRIRRILIQFGQTLGRFDLEGQLQGMDSIIQLCEREYTYLEKDRAARVQSFRTLGICAGIALSVIFV